MTEAWAFGGGPPVMGLATSVTVIEGSTFCVSKGSGDLRAGTSHGLFYRDNRVLSVFNLTVDAQSIEPLAAHLPAPYAATIIGRRPPRQGTADSTLLVIRNRSVGEGMLEEITVRNLGRERAAVSLSMAVDADFAGLFEVKEDRIARRRITRNSPSPGVLDLSYRVPERYRGVCVTGRGSTVAGRALTWQLVIAAHDETTVTIEVVPSVDGIGKPAMHVPGDALAASLPAARLAAWRQRTPLVSTPDVGFAELLAAGIEDLGVLRIADGRHPGRVVIAAGAPWFMTVFGRDSLLTSWMLLPADPDVALGTLQTLAELQGVSTDPVSEEQPGRILHEIRSGLDTNAVLGGDAVYYGSADATPLFVMLLAESRRWGASPEEVAALLPHADRALAWLTDYGDRDGDGFIEYLRATDRGLANQGWKDSFDGVTYANGELAVAPLAMAEIQGYAYAAYLGRASLATELGDTATARRWTDRAGILKEAFNTAFWLPERGYFALALDARKQPVDSLASNMGHCLWTGIIDDDKAASVVSHLLSQEMFSGFGIRTLGSSMGAYNPMSYHNGSVWPHDTAIVIAGLVRYGFIDEAQRVTLGLLDAAEQLDGRLPELFCGFGREEFSAPVPYPTSCAPQAWSAAAPLLILRSLLRFEPDTTVGRVALMPRLPERLLPLNIDRWSVAGRPVRIDVTTTGTTVTGLPPNISVSTVGAA